MIILNHIKRNYIDLYSDSANSINLYSIIVKGQPKRDLWLLQEYDNPSYDDNQEATVLNSYNNNWLIKDYETNIYEGFNEDNQLVLKLTESH